MFCLPDGSLHLCFVPGGDYKTVVQKLAPTREAPGEICHVDGRVLGAHDGISGFTIGQRRGLGVAVGEPLFVTRIEPGARKVIVGPKEHLSTRTLHLRAINWLGDAAAQPGAAHELFVKYRSTHAPVPAKLLMGEGHTGRVELADDHYGISPGQACVFYDGAQGARVLGGGWISAAKSGG